MNQEIDVMKPFGRNRTIDIVKGICMFCVIWGHVIQKCLLDVGYEQNVIYKFIYTFHMPLLMFFSGYLFYSSIQKYSYQELLKRKMMQLAIPIFVWNTIYYTLDVLFFNAVDVGTISVIGYIKYFFTGLWFLWAVLFYSIILTFIERIENKKYRIVLIMLSFPVLLISPNRWRLIFEYCYFLAGYAIKSYNARMNDTIIVRILAIGGGIALVIYSVWHSFLRMDISDFVLAANSRNIVVVFEAALNLFFAFIISSIGCFVVTWISKILTKIPAKSIERVMNLVVWLGRNSLQLYVLQRIIVELCFANIIKQYDIHMFTNIGILNIILSFVIAIIFTGIICILIKVFEKVHVDGILFGRTFS